MATSKLDAVYRSILITKFFTKGWGKPENLRRLFEFRKVVSNRDECFKLIPKDYPVTITKDEKTSDCRILEGHFMSPLEKLLPGIVPQCAQEAHFQVVLPLEYRQPDYKPVCLHLAGTGDHIPIDDPSIQFFWRRRNLVAKPLLKEAGIGAIILENPFYGKRKPVDQVRSSLHNVSDIFVMGGCLMLESLVLFHWCERNGLGPLGVTGLSMGGHMASLAASNWPKPLVLVPCLSWSTASVVFTEGVMSHSINWDLLESQYLSDGEYSNKLAKMVAIVDEAFIAGKKFAKNFSQTVDKDGAKLTPVDANNNNSHVAKVESISDNPVKAQHDGLTKITKDTNLEKELQGLLVSEKISQSLYDKLTMNEKFNLETKDITELNKLCEKEQLKNLSGFAAKYSLIDTGKGFENVTTDMNTNLDLGNTTIQELQLDRPIPQTVTLEKHQIEEKVQSNKTHNPDINSDIIAATSPEATSKPEVLKEKSRNITEATLEILSNIPYLSRKSQSKKIDITKIHWRDHDALQFMRGVMDECTHLSNFSVPHDTSLIIAVCAKHDAYVPREDVGSLEDIWPGAEVRYVDAGHVSAYVLHQSLFRSCIVEAFERSRKKWRNGQHVE